MSSMILNDMSEKRKLEGDGVKSMEPPIKKFYVDEDILDLSRKANGIEHKVDDDVILLSEDEDEQLISTLCEEMEKENAPSAAIREKSRALFLKIENELRNEEAALLLLQQLRSNQRSYAPTQKIPKTSSSSTPPPHRTTNAQAPQGRPINHQPVQRTQVPTTNRVSTTNVLIPTVIPTASTGAPSVPKVTKVMAIQALEQQCNGKKIVLQKHLERTLDKVLLPRPSGSDCSSEVSFVPSLVTNEFMALVGLEEIVNTIQDYDPNDPEKVTNSNSGSTPPKCTQCGTDFTPVWKPKVQGSNDVICEACVVDSQRSGIHKSFKVSVAEAIKQYKTSEHEVESELQDAITIPAKLEAFIKEHERKLMASQQAQLNQQQLQQQQQQQNLPSGSIPGQRYHQQSGFQAQNIFTNLTGSRHSTVTAAATAVNSLTSGQLQSATTRRSSLPATAMVSSASAPSLALQQQQLQQTQQPVHSAATASANSVVQQLASQYQQLTKAVAAAASNQGSTNHPLSNLMMAAAVNPMLVAAAAAANANNQQQQQQVTAQQQAAAVVQQRLAALSSLQQQQQQHQSTTNTSALDQFSQMQMQTLLMNSLFGAAAAQNTQTTSAAATNRQQQQMLQQTLIQYIYLMQQQQQQQQQQQAAVQAQQQQVNAAVLQQLMANSANNPAAFMAMLQNLYSASGGNTKK